MKILLECTKEKGEFIIEAIEQNGCNTYKVINSIEDFIEFYNVNRK